MVLDTIDIDLLTKRFNPNGLAVTILDNLFFIESDELIQFPISHHGNGSHHIRRTNGHATVNEDQKSLDDLTNLLAGFFFPNDLDDFCPGMNSHPKFLLHQTEMAFVRSKQMKEIVWMR